MIRAHQRVTHLAQFQLSTVDPLPRTAMLSQTDDDGQTFTIAILPTIQYELWRHETPRRERYSFVRHRVGASFKDSDLSEHRTDVGVRRREMSLHPGTSFPGCDLGDVVFRRSWIGRPDVCRVCEDIGPQGEETGVVVFGVGGSSGEDGVVV